MFLLKFFLYNAKLYLQNLIAWKTHTTEFLYKIKIMIYFLENVLIMEDLHGGAYERNFCSSNYMVRKLDGDKKIFQKVNQQ